jgi:nitric oxide synthase oxygenase domain/subunit
MATRASTQFVQSKFGWQSARTQFDVLPLVLQADGEDPEMFLIPEEIILQVNLKHPK